jgi:hypothetical protein
MSKCKTCKWWITIAFQGSLDADGPVRIREYRNTGAVGEQETPGAACCRPCDSWADLFAKVPDSGCPHYEEKEDA